MADIIGFNNKKQNPVNLQLVEALKHLLERAEKGDLRTLVGVGQNNDGSLLSAWVIDTNPNYYELLGMAHHLSTMVEERIKELR